MPSVVLEGPVPLYPSRLVYGRRERLLPFLSKAVAVHTAGQRADPALLCAPGEHAFPQTTALATVNDFQQPQWEVQPASRLNESVPAQEERLAPGAAAVVTNRLDPDIALGAGQPV